MMPVSLFRPAYRPDIDGLRAVAVVAVMGFHAFPEALPGAFVGVDVFFVVSGYLISLLIAESYAAGHFSFRSFYARRICRLFPALILLFAACLVVGWFTFWPGEYRLLGKHIVAGAGFVANYALLGEIGYFDAAADSKPLLHLWSLGVEEQFYLIWPPVLAFLLKRKWHPGPIILFLAAASFLFNVVYVQDHAAAAFYVPQTRFWELLSGAFLACGMKDKGGLFARKWADLFFAVGAVLLALAFWHVGRGQPYPGLWGIVPVAAVVLLIAPGPAAWGNRVLLSHPIAVGVGLISYPLYLWHWFLLSCGRVLYNATPPIAVRGALLILSVGLAWATYRFVERPFRTGRASGAKLAFLIGTMTMLGGAGFFVFNNDGMPDRPAFAAYDEVERQQTISYYLGRPPEARVAVLGDSHALHLDPGLYGLYGRQVAMYATVACLPLVDVDRYDHRFAPGTCLGKINTFFAAFLDNPVRTGLVLASMGPVYLTDVAFGGMNKDRVTGQEMSLATRPDLRDRWQMFEIALRETLRRATGAGKDVLFVFDIPELGFDPHGCFVSRPVVGALFARYPCAVARSAHDARTERYKSVVKDVLRDFPTVRAYDPTDDFCDKDWCWAGRDGVLLYRDADHLNFAGSDFMAKHLRPYIDTMLARGQ